MGSSLAPTHQALTQRDDRPAQMALHRVDRHTEGIRYLRRFHFLLIPQHNYQSGALRQFRNQFLEPFGDEYLARLRRMAWIGERVGGELLAMVSPPDLVDAPVAGDAPQPRDDVRVRLQAMQAPVQL